LIPSMNWHGAVIATYVAEIAMGLILFHLANKYSRTLKMRVDLEI